MANILKFELIAPLMSDEYKRLRNSLDEGIFDNEEGLPYGIKEWKFKCELDVLAECKVYHNGRYIKSINSDVTEFEFVLEDMKRGVNIVEIYVGVVNRRIVLNCWNIHTFLYMYAEEFKRVRSVINSIRESIWLSECNNVKIRDVFGKLCKVIRPYGYTLEQYRALLYSVNRIYDIAGTKKAIEMLMDVFNEIDYDIIEYSKEKTRLRIGESFKLYKVGASRYKWNGGWLFYNKKNQYLKSGERDIFALGDRYVYIDGEVDIDGCLILKESDIIVKGSYILGKIIVDDLGVIIDIKGCGRIGDEYKVDSNGIRSDDGRYIGSEIMSDGYRKLGFELNCKGKVYDFDEKNVLVSVLRESKLAQSIGLVSFGGKFYDESGMNGKV